MAIQAELGVNGPGEHWHGPHNYGQYKYDLYGSDLYSNFVMAARISRRSWQSLEYLGMACMVTAHIVMTNKIMANAARGLYSNLIVARG